MSTEARLHQAVDNLLNSYTQHSELVRIGKKRLPARENIINLVKDIQILLFPGIIRYESLDTLDLRYVIGQKTSSIFQRLKEYMEQVLCWEVSQEGGNCQEDPQFAGSVTEIALDFLEELPKLREVLAEDVEAIFQGDPAAHSREEIVLGYPGLHALSIYRIAHYFQKRKIPLLPRIMSEYVHSKTGIDIHPGAQIGRGTMIDHGTGIVIGETALIGDHVRLYQGVTLGALSPTKKMAATRAKRHPTIEDHVVIYAGATILGGNTTVGSHSIIGGNVWLTHSVPPHSRIVWNVKDQQCTVQTNEIMLCSENGS